MNHPMPTRAMPTIVPFPQQKTRRKEQQQKRERQARIDKMYKALSNCEDLKPIMARLPQAFALGLRDFIVNEVYLWLYNHMKPAPKTLVLTPELKDTLNKKITGAYSNLNPHFLYLVDMYAFIETHILREKGIEMIRDHLIRHYIQIRPCKV